MCLVESVYITGWNSAVHVCEDNLDPAACECRHFGFETTVHRLDTLFDIWYQVGNEIGDDNYRIRDRSGEILN